MSLAKRYGSMLSVEVYNPNQFDYLRMPVCEIVAGVRAIATKSGKA